MLANTAKRPFDSDDWLFEIKWDGYRAISIIEKGNAVIYSRNSKDISDDYRDIRDKLQQIKVECVLDGEIVYLGKNAKPDFSLLSRSKNTDSKNIIYYLFDILYLDGYQLTGLPLKKRKEILLSVIPDLDSVKISDHVVGKGKILFEAASKEELEGIMAKKMDSIYVLGRRTDDWLKIKNTSSEEFLVGGYKTSNISNRRISSLLLGKYSGKTKKLKYFGKVASGLEGGKNKDLYNRLISLKTSTDPFGGKVPKKGSIQWTVPEMIVEVEYSHKTGKGLLRHPSFKGVRNDRDPEEIIEETGKEMPGKKENGKSILKKVNIVNQDKIFWPQEGYTKKDLIDYYIDIRKFILPYILDRPQSLNRHPDGIEGKSFFQKDIEYELPGWMESRKISSGKDGKTNYLVCNGIESLIYMVNLGCIEINPWNSRVEDLQRPDVMVLDLDPKNVSFEEVIAVALKIKTLFDKVQIPAYPKTSGKRGLHIYIPLGARYEYKDVLDFSKLLVKIIHSKIPEKTSLVRNPDKRPDGIYLDYLQNRFGQTVAAPYSVRPVIHAPVSTPLEWSELKSGLQPQEHNISSVPKRLAVKGDLFRGVLDRSIDMLKIIQELGNYFNL